MAKWPICVFASLSESDLHWVCSHYLCPPVRCPPPLIYWTLFACTAPRDIRREKSDWLWHLLFTSWRALLSNAHLAIRTDRGEKQVSVFSVTTPQRNNLGYYPINKSNPIRGGSPRHRAPGLSVWCPLHGFNPSIIQRLGFTRPQLIMHHTPRSPHSHFLRRLEQLGCMPVHKGRGGLKGAVIHFHS